MVLCLTWQLPYPQPTSGDSVPAAQPPQAPLGQKTLSSQKWPLHSFGKDEEKKGVPPACCVVTISEVKSYKPWVTQGGLGEVTFSNGNCFLQQRQQIWLLEIRGKLKSNPRKASDWSLEECSALIHTKWGNFSSFLRTNTCGAGFMFWSVIVLLEK